MNLDTASITEDGDEVGEGMFLHHCLTIFCPVLLPLSAAAPVHLAIESSNSGTEMVIFHF